ncbi:hypothetical protein BDY24DRAFT_393696 [Mrakia frigida]|uniref:uncharacterized protein n=1 Tax=Mrakia frigida TaxID=29902 RepID=UPI003FCC0699
MSSFSTNPSNSPSPSSSSRPTDDTLWSLTAASMPTILILGGSYGGLQCASTLIKGGLPEGWRVIVVDRNDHFNHLYVFPRVSILPEYAPKAFIPITQLLPPPHLYLHSTLISLSATHATVSLPPSSQTPTTLSIPYQYLVYALGGSLPPPIDLSKSDGTKAAGLEMLKIEKKKIDSLKKGGRVLVIGGGALGIQLASDVREAWKGEREVCLLHSRERLLNRFGERMHEETKSRFDALGITYFLGERAIIPPEGFNLNCTTPKSVTTSKGNVIQCDVILMCTGQTPLSHHLIPHFNSCIDPKTKLVRVLKTTQIESGEATGETAGVDGRMFAIGDCCYQQDVVMAGYTAYNQGTVAGKNILKHISHSTPSTSASSSTTPSTPLKLDEYEWEAPAIKLTLGILNYMIQTPDDSDESIDPKQRPAKYIVGENGEEDLGVDGMWKFFGVGDVDRTE